MPVELPPTASGMPLSDRLDPRTVAHSLSKASLENDTTILLPRPVLGGAPHEAILFDGRKSFSGPNAKGTAAGDKISTCVFPDAARSSAPGLAHIHFTSLQQFSNKVELYRGRCVSSHNWETLFNPYVAFCLRHGHVCSIHYICHLQIREIWCRLEYVILSCGFFGWRDNKASKSQQDPAWAVVNATGLCIDHQEPHACVQLPLPPGIVTARSIMWCA